MVKVTGLSGANISHSVIYSLPQLPGWWLQVTIPAQAPTGLTQADRGYETNEHIHVVARLGNYEGCAMINTNPSTV